MLQHKDVEGATWDEETILSPFIFTAERQAESQNH